MSSGLLGVRSQECKRFIMVMLERYRGKRSEAGWESLQAAGQI